MYNELGKVSPAQPQLCNYMLRATRHGVLYNVEFLDYCE